MPNDLCQHSLPRGTQTSALASFRKRLGIWFIVTMTIILTLSHAAAQSSSRSPSETPNFTGFWALRFDSENIPKASLLPGITLKQIEAHQQQDLHTVRWCQYVGMPFLMESQAPLDILQGQTQMVIISETPSAVRHIYTDRTSHPDPTTFDPGRNGNSIGHWDKDTLVVDTAGFNDEGYTSLPGGGFRTPTSHLKERYRLVANGKQLEVTFTWDDPKLFAKPHTYSYRYYRVPRSYNAEEDFCDSNDPDRARFLTTVPIPVE